MYTCNDNIVKIVISRLRGGGKGGYFCLLHQIKIIICRFQTVSFELDAQWLYVKIPINLKHCHVFEVCSTNTITDFGLYDLN